MKLSVQTAPILDDHGIDKGFGMIAEAGFDCVDFNIDHYLPGSVIRSGKLSSVFDKSPAEISAAVKPYLDAARAHGVGFGQAHAPFPTWVDGQEETNAYLRMSIERCLEICAEAGCPWLVVHPAFNSYAKRLTAEREWQVNIDMYSSFIPAMERTGVGICTENMWAFYKHHIVEACMSDPQEGARMVDELNAIAGKEIFGYCLDSGHVALLGRDIYKFIKTLGKRIRVVHLHDNDGRDDEHLFPWDGVIDWDAVCQGLREIGYSGTLSFETFNGLASRDKELAPDLLKYLGAIARLLRSRIEG